MSLSKIPNRFYLSRFSLKKAKWDSFFIISALSIVTLSILISGCTLKARNQDKFNRLLAKAMASIDTSILSVSSNTLKSGETATVTLTIKDRSSVQNSIGGHTVTFSLSGGTSAGTFSSTVDNRNGTYTSVFTATGKGTPSTLSASIQDIGTVVQTESITVVNSAPTITVLGNRLFPLDSNHPPLVQGSTYTLVSIHDADGDSFTGSCTYQTLGLNSLDPNYAAAGTDCNRLDTLTTGNSGVATTGKLTLNNGKLDWTPTSSQRGTYQFTVKSSDGSATSETQTFTLSVRENSTTANLLTSLDGLFSASATGLSASSAASPLSSSDSVSNWLNLLSSAPAGSCSFGSSSAWTGTGQASSTTVDPYRLQFTSANSDSISMGTVLNSATKFGIEAWVKPSSPSTAGSIIASNGGGDGNGFVLRQSIVPTSRAEFVVGKKYYSYKDLILSHKPAGYWRLGETSGTTANDLSPNKNDGTYSGGYTQGQNGTISGDSDKSISFNGSTAYVNVPHSASIDPLNAWTLEAWVRRSTTGVQHSILEKYDWSASFGNYAMRISASDKLQGILRVGTGGSDAFCNSTTSLAANTWYHVAITYSYSAQTLICYVNGIPENTNSSASIVPASSTVSLKIGARANDLGSKFNGRIDEPAIYNYVLPPAQITEHYQTGLNGNYKSYPGNAILADNPIGYWRLGESSGRTAYDSSGNNRNGTYKDVILNHAGALTGDLNTSGRFNGSSSNIMTVPSNSLIPSASQAFSITAWVNPSSISNIDARNRIVSVLNGNTSSAYALGLGNTNKLQFYNASDTSYMNSTQNISLNVWTHVGITFNGTCFQLYINGTTDGSCVAKAGTLPSANNTYIGAFNSTSPGFFAGKIDEVAIYDYALSSTQIASQYNLGAGAGWWICQSQTLLNSSSWTLLSTIYDGTTAQLFVNGQQQCSVTPGTTYSGTVSQTKVGSSPNGSSFWSGALAIFKIFGTSDSTKDSITSALIKSDFDTESNRFRAVAAEPIVTQDLVLNLDAAQANQGLSFYPNGCAASDLLWADLSSNGANGSLSSFSSCGAHSGWVGDGTVSSPRALAFDFVDDYVDTSTLGSFGSNFNAGITVISWLKTTNTTHVLDLGGIQNGGSTTTIRMNINAKDDLTVLSGSLRVVIRDDNGNRITTATNSSTKINDGNWHQYATTYDQAKNKILIYLDGTVLSTITVPVGSAPSQFSNFIYPFAVGGFRSVATMAGYFSGSMANFLLYNRVLADKEIKQTCLAQEGRFTATAGSICAQP